MSWYRIGTVNVTNGSVNVVGVGTDFVSNVNPGDGFIAPDGKVYEVAGVTSQTAMTLTSNYLGATAAAQSYSMFPTQSFARDLALGAATLLNTFAAVRDGIGQGLIPDGTLAAPGIRFSADQDTGVRRLGTNSLALVTGGVDRLVADANGIWTGGLVSVGGANGTAVQISYSGAGGAIQSYNGLPLFLNALGNNTLLNRDGGNVGIGTASPLHKLHIAGNIHVGIGLRSIGNIQAAPVNNGNVTLDFGSKADGTNLTGMRVRQSWDGTYNDEEIDFLTHDGGVSAGVRMTIDKSGNVGIGTAAPTSFGAGNVVTEIKGGMFGALLTSNAVGGGAVGQIFANGSTSVNIGSRSNHSLTFTVNNGEVARFDTSGNLLVGSATAYGLNAHTMQKGTGQEDLILNVTGATWPCFRAYSGATSSYSSAATALRVAANSVTGRSINAAGTINASGADYAEYMRRALSCGTILAGDVCGVDRNGELVTNWAEMLRPVVKSEQPGFVGGDTWDKEVGPAPEKPQPETVEYEGPLPPVEPIEPTPYEPVEIALPVEPVRDEDEDDDAFAIRAAQYAVARASAEAAIVAEAQRRDEADAAQARYAADLNTFKSERTAYDKAQRAHEKAVAAAAARDAAALDKFEADHADWKERHEAARKGVDRIAYAGQVPVNVGPATLAEIEAALADGDTPYLIAIQKGTGISVKVVRESAMTLPDYMKKVGPVFRIDDGRPIIDVQHG